MRNEPEFQADRIEASQVRHIEVALMKHQDSLCIIWERMSEYIIPTDIPLQLKSAERYHKRRIAELKAELERLNQNLST